MTTNGKITIYHKSIENRTEKWTKKTYEAWHYLSLGGSIDKGYDNGITVRIPYYINSADIQDFAVGDIIFIGEGPDIKRQTDLKASYNITSLNNNTIGREPHIRLNGK